LRLFTTKTKVDDCEWWMKLVSVDGSVAFQSTASYTNAQEFLCKVPEEKDRDQVEKLMTTGLNDRRGVHAPQFRIDCTREAQSEYNEKIKKLQEMSYAAIKILLEQDAPKKRKAAAKRKRDDDEETKKTKAKAKAKDEEEETKKPKKAKAKAKESEGEEEEEEEVKTKAKAKKPRKAKAKKQKTEEETKKPKTRVPVDFEMPRQGVLQQFFESSMYRTVTDSSLIKPCEVNGCDERFVRNSCRKCGAFRCSEHIDTLRVSDGVCPCFNGASNTTPTSAPSFSFSVCVLLIFCVCVRGSDCDRVHDDRGQSVLSCSGGGAVSAQLLVGLDRLGPGLALQVHARSGQPHALGCRCIRAQVPAVCHMWQAGPAFALHGLRCMHTVHRQEDGAMHTDERRALCARRVPRGHGRGSSSSRPRHRDQSTRSVIVSVAVVSGSSRAIGAGSGRNACSLADPCGSGPTCPHRWTRRGRVPFRIEIFSLCV
jgi:hypothetical protein